MQNLDKVNELQGKVANSAGSAEKKFNDAYSNSIEAKVNNLKRSLEQLYMSLTNSTSVKTAVSGINSFVKALDVLIKSSAGTKVAIVGLGFVVARFVVSFKALLTAMAGGKSITFLEVIFGKLGVKIAGTSLVTKLLAGDFVGLKASMMGLLTNPATWMFVGLAAAIGAATFVLTKHIKKQQELKKENEDLKKSFDDMNKAINSKDTKGFTDASYPLAEKQRKMKELVKERKKLEQELKGTVDIGKAMKLNKVDGEISEAVKQLKSLGMTVDETTGKIRELDEAQNLNAAQEMINKTEEQANARFQEIDSIVAQIDEYKNLSAQENLNAEQKARLTQLAYGLMGSIDGLTVTTDSHGNAVIANTGLLDQNKGMLIKEKGEIMANAQASFENARARIQNEIEKTQSVIDNTNKRIEAIQAENAALAQRDAVTQNKNMSIGQRFWSVVTGKGIDPYSYDEASKKNSAAYQQQIAEQQKASDHIQNLKKQLSGLKPAQISASAPNFSGGGGSDSSGGGYFPDDVSGKKDKKGRSKKDGADKAKRDAEKAEKERKEALKKALEDKINQYEMAIREIDKNIAIARNRMELYSDKGDNNRVVLMNNIESYTKQKLSQLQSKENFIRSEINSGKYEADTIKDLKGKLIDVQQNISDVYISFKKLKMEFIDEKYKAKTEGLVKAVENLKNKMSEIDSADTFNKQKLDYMNQMILKLQQQRDITKAYVGDLEKQYAVAKKNNDYANRSALQDSLEKYKKELQELNIEIIKEMTNKKNLIKDLTFEIEKLDEFNRVLEETNNRLKEHNFLLSDLEIKIETLKNKEDFIGAFKVYDEYLTAMNGKMLELGNQSNALGNTMQKLQEKFKSEFKVDITKMDKKQLNDLQERLFSKRITNSKEEKEALEKQAELFKQLVGDYEQLQDAIHENKSAMDSINNDIIIKQKEQLNLVQELTKDMQDKVKEMLRKEVEDEKKMYDERLETLRKFIDDRQKELDRQWSQDDYDRELQKKVEEKNKLEADIASKSRDTSITGKAEVTKLKEELKKMQQDIEDFQRNRNRDLQKQNLQDELQTSEKNTENKKKELDKKYDEEKLNMLSKEALIKGYYESVNGRIISLKESMINFTKQTADGLSVVGKKIQEELINKLSQIQQFLNTNSGLFPQLSPANTGIKDIQNGIKSQFYTNLISPMLSGLTPSRTDNKSTTFNFDSAIKVDGNIYDSNDLMNLIEQGASNIPERIKIELQKVGFK